MLQIIICIILLIPLLIILFRLMKDVHVKAKEELEKNPWRYQPRPKRRRRSSEYTYTGLPWMGGKKIKKRY